MNLPHLGLTNPYLRFGLGFVLLALALIATFAFTSNFVALYAAGVFFWSGVVLYVGGRIAKSRKTSSDA